MARKITCINENGVGLTFDDRFNPWMLENCEGLYEVKNNVSMSANTMTDGATYQGSVTQMRNIVLSLRDDPKGDHEANRKILYALFKSKSPGKFTYYENSTVRQIEYHVESVIIDSKKNSRRATISLLCPDPFFVDLEDISVQMSGWVADFEWEHAFSASGEQFGYRENELLKTIENESGVENIGLTITIDIFGNVTNPKITHVEMGESIEIGHTGNPLTLTSGDKIIITTHKNNKHVYLISNNTTTEINAYLSEDSEFLQIMSGDNTFGYSAGSGESNMAVTISFKYRYAGV